MEILYQDNRVLVCLKPAGVLSTNEPCGVPELLRQQLGEERGCVRTVHRLDRDVGGVMVLARSREATRLLAAQVRGRGFQKEYLAAVHGAVTPQRGTLRDLLLRSREEQKTHVVDAPGKDVQEAVLDYKTLCRKDGMSLVSIRLHTGRTHQIRCQFASRGLPLVGDRKYGAPGDGCPIALWSHYLSFAHPATGEMMALRLPPPGDSFPWTEFNY